MINKTVKPVTTDMEAIDQAIEIWTILADNGCTKKVLSDMHPEYNYLANYAYCPLCYLSKCKREDAIKAGTWKPHNASCRMFCSYVKHFGCYCLSDLSPYSDWDRILDEETDEAEDADRKEAAERFLAQLKELKADYKPNEESESDK